MHSSKHLFHLHSTPSTHSTQIYYLNPLSPPRRVNGNSYRFSHHFLPRLVGGHPFHLFLLFSFFSPRPVGGRIPHPSDFPIHQHISHPQSRTQTVSHQYSKVIHATNYFFHHFLQQTISQKTHHLFLTPTCRWFILTHRRQLFPLSPISTCR